MEVTNILRIYIIQKGTQIRVLSLIILWDQTTSLFNRLNGLSHLTSYLQKLKLVQRQKKHTNDLN